MALVSQREFARMRGVNEKSVREAIANGRITATKIVKGKRLIDSEKANAEWDANTDFSFIRNQGAKQNTKNNLPTFQESRAIREAYNARITKLEYEEKTGKLVDFDQVKAAGFELSRRVRNAILNIPGKVAAEAAAETDPHKIELMLMSELEEALRDLAKG